MISDASYKGRVSLIRTMLMKRKKSTCDVLYRSSSKFRCVLPFTVPIRFKVRSCPCPRCQSGFGVPVVPSITPASFIDFHQRIMARFSSCCSRPLILTAIVLSWYSFSHPAIHSVS